MPSSQRCVHALEPTLPIVYLPRPSPFRRSFAPPWPLPSSFVPPLAPSSSLPRLQPLSSLQWFVPLPCRAVAVLLLLVRRLPAVLLLVRRLPAVPLLALLVLCLRGRPSRSAPSRERARETVDREPPCAQKVRSRDNALTKRERESVMESAERERAARASNERSARSRERARIQRDRCDSRARVCRD